MEKLLRNIVFMITMKNENKMKTKLLMDPEITSRCEKIEKSIINLDKLFPQRLTSLPVTDFFDESFQNTVAFCEMIRLNLSPNSPLIQIKVVENCVKERLIFDMDNLCVDWHKMRLDSSLNSNFWEYSARVFLYALDSTLVAYWSVGNPTIIFCIKDILESSSAKERSYSVEEVANNMGEYFVSADEFELSNLEKTFRENYLQS